MSNTPNLGITHLTSGQSQKEVTANLAFDRFDNNIAGLLTKNFASDGDLTLGTSSPAYETEHAVIVLTDSGTVLTTGRNVIMPDGPQWWFVKNSTAQTLTFKTAAGTGVAVSAGDTKIIRADGTNVVEVVVGISSDTDAVHLSSANEISTATEKGSPVSADLILIEDSEASGVKKKIQVGNLPGGAGGGHTIQDDGSSMTARSNLNFIGFDVSDNSGDDSTDVSAPTNLSGIVSVPEVSAVESFSPSLSWTTNTTASGRKWRLGALLFMEIDIDLSGAPDATNLDLTLPDSLSIDTTDIGTGSWASLVHNAVVLNDSDGKQTRGGLHPVSSTTIRVAYENLSDAHDLYPVTQTGPVTWASGDSITIRCAVPISGWANSKEINVGKIPAMFSASVSRSTNQTIASGSWDNVEFTSEEIDDNSMVDLGSNSERVYIPAGCDRVMVTGYIDLDSAATGNIAIKVGGNWYSQFTTNSTNSDRVSVAAGPLNTSGGEYVELVCYYASGATITSARLSVVTWNSASPRASAFKGALVTRITSAHSLTTGVHDPIDFNSEEYDTDGFHDNATNPERLTIPAGVSKVRLAANIKMDNSDTSLTFLFSIQKNGLMATGLPQVRVSELGSGDQTFNISSAVVNVEEGDYFTATVYSSDANNVVQGTQTWFSIEVVE